LKKKTEREQFEEQMDEQTTPPLIGELALAGNTGNKHALPKLPALPGQGRRKVLGRCYFVRKKCIPGVNFINVLYTAFA
jgi:hypothetical protein